MTPSPPRVSNGNAHESSPESTEKPAGRSRRMVMICSRFAEASLTATIRGCSASRMSVAESTLQLVRPGTL